MQIKTRRIYVKVAGVTFEGRQAKIRKLRGDEPVRIVPEPTNPYDPNALAVHVAMPDKTIEHIGYVPKDLAKDIAPALDGESVMCKIDSLTGGFETQEGDIASLGVVLCVEIPADEDEAPF